MRILAMFALCVSFLFADLIDIYRTQGIDAVKEKLEKQLQEKSYWNNFLEKKDVTYGYYESKKFLILVEKGTKELKVLENVNNLFSQVVQDNVIVGEKPGDKQIEGDLKTPEGVYELTSKLTKLDPFYGPLALVTSYPNTFDKAMNKKGHGIWIHGMPLNEKREEFTQGCIALDNPNLVNLDKSIRLNEALVLISEGKIEKVKKDDISSILSFIYKWKDAWRKSDIERYLSFYSNDFRRYDGLGLDGFSQYKKRIFSRKEDKTIVFSNINIIPYPNSLNKKMYKVLMDEKYRTRNYKFDGKKELFIELKDNSIKILTEG
ncbi:L,D-transpeptidase family protein [Malaciobacter marinus]|jgi:murein L,D-transpeptidase YafK|uniref:L,D-transpeptidase family protein n=1 Tax=Malaciobacter marinus TaxID=505249 RepID=UPI0009A85965|nr:L,D-transpeptidase family protein [Malaciobacter marinus]SKB59396.1 Murein L,D-transpeptidase YafK [Malaciobacter marinus]